METVRYGKLLTTKSKVNPKISILMPTYNGAKYIKATLRSILSQNYTNFELIVCDDKSTDSTRKVIMSYNDKRIRYYENRKNLGYPGNLSKCRQKAEGEIIYLMGQDDIMANGVLQEIVKIFKDDEDVGAITRPYFWFHSDPKKPVRAKKRVNKNHNEVIRIDSPSKLLIEMLSTLDQLSGLAYRRKYMRVRFSKDIFPCHIYPFLDILKRHPIVFLRNYTIAVRINSSQTRHLSSIYEKSPVQSWVDMFNTILHERRFEKTRKILIKNFVARNYVGLVQIRNYTKYRYLIREILLLVKYNCSNILNIRFWFFSLGTLITPPVLLIPLVEMYKEHIYSKFIKDVKFNQ